eukprot:1156272-Pelagomonas_calceolata.AAC.11
MLQQASPLMRGLRESVYTLAVIGITISMRGLGACVPGRREALFDCFTPFCAAVPNQGCPCVPLDRTSFDRRPLKRLIEQCGSTLAVTFTKVGLAGFICMRPCSATFLHGKARYKAKNMACICKN